MLASQRPQPPPAKMPEEERGATKVRKLMLVAASLRGRSHGPFVPTRHDWQHLLPWLGVGRPPPPTGVLAAIAVTCPSLNMCPDLIKAPMVGGCLACVLTTL